MNEIPASLDSNVFSLDRLGIAFNVDDFEMLGHPDAFERHLAATIEMTNAIHGLDIQREDLVVTRDIAFGRVNVSVPVHHVDGVMRVRRPS